MYIDHEQTVRMLLSGIEFIALISALIIGGALLISVVGAVWMGYSDRLQRRGGR